MCLSSPKIPAPPPPTQEAKNPDVADPRKLKKSPAGGGSLLTGAAGVAPSTLSTGGTTLLGG